jgi:hypothetical protein
MLAVDLVENLLIAPFFQSRPAPWAGVDFDGLISQIPPSRTEAPGAAKAGDTGRTGINSV